MAAALEHRGPDDSGLWVDAADGVALGHRRLSVVGLGPTGHQPMVSAAGRFVLNYNGEIYNYPALRRRLESVGVAVGGGSDTEVLLGAIERWGLDDALDACEGMFALALWDRTATSSIWCATAWGRSRSTTGGWARTSPSPRN